METSEVYNKCLCMRFAPNVPTERIYPLTSLCYPPIVPMEQKCRYHIAPSGHIVSRIDIHLQPKSDWSGNGSLFTNRLCLQFTPNVPTERIYPLTSLCYPPIVPMEQKCRYHIAPSGHIVSRIDIHLQPKSDWSGNGSLFTNRLCLQFAPNVPTERIYPLTSLCYPPIVPMEEKCRYHIAPSGQIVGRKKFKRGLKRSIGTHGADRKDDSVMFVTPGTKTRKITTYIPIAVRRPGNGIAKIISS